MKAFKLIPAPLRETILRKSVAAAEEDAKFRAGQPTMWGSLRNVSRYFTPAGIVDIGANIGAWSQSVSAIFPGVPIHMIEAQPELRTNLEATGFPFTIALLGATQRDAVPFFLSGTGSSAMEEVTEFDHPAVPLPMERIDTIEQIRSMRGPLLLKLDVQGYELEVLSGATETLERTEVILSEVSLLPYNRGAPLAHEVIAWLTERDFLPFDICGGWRRSSDMALAQADMIFVRSNSTLRAKRKFWAHEE